MSKTSERGFAIVVVLVATVVLLALAAIVFPSVNPRHNVVDEESRRRAVRCAEAGIALAKARIQAVDEPKLDRETRARVIRDFGDGAQEYELLPLPAEGSARGQTHLRIVEVGNGTNGLVVATAVAEYRSPVKPTMSARCKLQAMFRRAEHRSTTTVRWWEIP